MSTLRCSWSPGTGAVLHATGERNLGKLGGLLRFQNEDLTAARTGIEGAQNGAHLVLGDAVGDPVLATVAKAMTVPKPTASLGPIRSRSSMNPLLADQASGATIWRWRWR